MARLPVIIGFGGINAAGRSSFHHGYRRLVIDAVNQRAATSTFQDLATLMGITNMGIANIDQHRSTVLEGTLVRKIDSQFLNAHQVEFNQKMNLQLTEQPLQFTLKKRELPDSIPAHWQVNNLNDNDNNNNNEVSVQVSDQLSILFPESRPNKVQSAGQLPSGFRPDTLYQSRNHPRGLQMTVYGASDAIQSTGISWDTIAASVKPDQVAVYASSAMGQLDDNGTGGMMKFPSQGQRTTSKQCALGFSNMPADFINAYILGSVGATGGSMGACATFLYNLRQGVSDIQTGKRRVVLVGTSEAPIVAEIMEGYRTMGALAEDEALLQLDKHLGLKEVNHRRACRPFADNCGFTIAESAQYILLCDDELAVELGAQIHGAIPDVFVHADGYKKSISAPGIGNYITLAKATRLASDLLGEDAVRYRSYIHAHGTGTPQNRVTESHILNEVAKTFGIQHWPVAAVKCYLGHSIGSAAGDQLIAALGTWEYGLIPGIQTIERVADDVHQSNLTISNRHTEVGKVGMDVSFINSKGFGGNNATALVFGPHIAHAWIEQKQGKKSTHQFLRRQDFTREQADAYDVAAIRFGSKPIYRFGEGVLEGEDLRLDKQSITLPGFAQKIDLASPVATLYYSFKKKQALTAQSVAHLEDDSMHSIV